MCDTTVLFASPKDFLYLLFRLYRQSRLSPKHVALPFRYRLCASRRCGERGFSLFGFSPVKNIVFTYCLYPIGKPCRESLRGTYGAPYHICATFQLIFQMNLFFTHCISCVVGLYSLLSQVSELYLIMQNKFSFFAKHGLHFLSVTNNLVIFA